MGQVLILELMSPGFGKERHMLTFAENREFKEADSKNFVQSSLKSHSLWVHESSKMTGRSSLIFEIICSINSLTYLYMHDS